MLLDVILFQTGKGIHAMLSPLHPLHLWKFVRLAEQLRDEKDTLSDDYKEVLGASAAASAALRDGAFRPGRSCLEPRARASAEHEFATLPCFQEESPHFAGEEGQDKLRRIIRKFLVLYPHAK